MKLTPYLLGASLLTGSISQIYSAYAQNPIPQIHSSDIQDMTVGNLCDRIIRGDTTVVRDIYSEKVAESLSSQEKVTFIKNVTRFILTQESDPTLVSVGMSIKEKHNKAFFGLPNTKSNPGLYQNQLDLEIRDYMKILIQYNYGKQLAPECMKQQSI